MKRTRILTTVTAALAAAAILAACGSSGGSVGAKSDNSGKVTVGDAWAREITTPSGDKAVYLKVTNGTDSSVDITGASVPATIAGEAQLHESMVASDTSSTTMAGDMDSDTSSTTMAGDMGSDTSSTTMAGGSMDDGTGQMTMKEISSVTVGAHKTVRFMPGGKHIMLIGMKKDLKAGDTFTLTLKMSSGKNLRTTVTVRST